MTLDARLAGQTLSDARHALNRARAIETDLEGAERRMVETLEQLRQMRRLAGEAVSELQTLVGRLQAAGAKEPA